jgi:hypothetical protein
MRAHLDDVLEEMVNRVGCATTSDFFWALASSGAQSGCPLASFLTPTAAALHPRARRGVSLGCEASQQHDDERVGELGFAARKVLNLGSEIDYLYGFCHLNMCNKGMISILSPIRVQNTI